MTNEDRELEELANLLHPVLADDAIWSNPADDLEDRLVAALAAEEAARSSTAAEAEGQQVDSPEPTAVPRRRRMLRARTAVIVLGAAAALVVALVLVLSARSDEATRFALAGTDLAPGARGRAQVTETESGLRIELWAKGLPRLDNGRFYQAWLRAPDGRLVPIGTFHTGDKVVLWAGVSLDEFPMLTVTQELADGNQASSGQRVLAGSVGS